MLPDPETATTPHPTRPANKRPASGHFPGDVLSDLITFARLEVEAHDIEPWAAVIGAAGLPPEEALWAVKAYNATDYLSSAWRILALCPGPEHWPNVDRAAVAALPLGGERRNLRGGKILRHLDSYVAHLRGATQAEWVREGVPEGSDRYSGFFLAMEHLRRVWGVGRLSAFEWAEFIHKVGGLRIETTDACLWESSGPRESLCRIWGEPTPTQDWLDRAAGATKERLAAEGVALSWWDFETVICDFNVMRKGRYYPGKHIAMIREEIESLPDPARTGLRAALRQVIPAPWCDLPPGASKELCQAYARTGLVPNPAR